MTNQEYGQAHKKLERFAKFVEPKESPEGEMGSWFCHLFDSVGIGATKARAYSQALNQHVKA